MKKVLFTGLALAVVGSMAIAGSAMATPMSLTLSDGSTSVTVFDGDVDGVLPDDSNPALGALTYIGAIGSNWAINVTTGLSAPILGSNAMPKLDLNSVNASSSNAGTLTITLSDAYATVADLGAGITSFVGSIGGTTSGTVDVSYFINGAAFNISWANMTKISGSSAFAGSLGDLIPVGDGDPFDLKIVATINHQAPGSTSFDSELKVPEPSLALLFGTGLMGLIGIGRRKARKQ